MFNTDLRTLHRVFAAAGANWQQDAAVQTELDRQGLRFKHTINWSDSCYTTSFHDSRVIVYFDRGHFRVSEAFSVGDKDLAVTVGLGHQRSEGLTAKVFLVPDGSIPDTINYLRGVISILEAVNVGEASE